MTKEEAIICLKGIKDYGRDTFTEQSDWQNSLDMAIKALEQQPCEDCVDRAEVNKLYDEYRPRLATHVSEFGDKLKALPSITPTETMPDNEQKVLVSPCFGRIF